MKKIYFLFVVFFVSNYSKGSIVFLNSPFLKNDSTKINKLTFHNYRTNFRENVKFYGNIRNDLFYDSRFNASARENLIDLFPLPKNIINGTDAYEKATFNFLAVTTRFGWLIDSLFLYKTKISGRIEADFLGSLDITYGTLRLRHAYIELRWKKFNLFLGQSYLPMNQNTDLIAENINFTSGSPFSPLGYGEQLRLTYKPVKNFYTTLSFFIPRNFAGFATSFVSTFQNTNINNTIGTPQYSIPDNQPSFNSILPSINLNLYFKNDKVLAGIMADFTRISPYNSYFDSSIKALNINHNNVESFSFFSYFMYKSRNLTFKLQTINSQNLTTGSMIGGYVGIIDKNGLESFKPINVFSTWSEFYINFNEWQPGIFIGYSAVESIPKQAKNVYAIGINVTPGMPTINYLWRIAPRIAYLYNKFYVGLELEYTSVNYQESKTPISYNVANFRSQLITIFYF